MENKLDKYLNNLNEIDNFMYIDKILDDENNYEDIEYIYNHCKSGTDSNSLYIIGYINHNKKNYEEAIKLYNKSIKLNNSFAMNNLGYMYSFGEGVKQNYEEAIKLYDESTKLDNYFAMNGLAHMYAYGNGIKKNYDKAVELYKKASSLGCSDSMYELVLLYYKEGVMNLHYEESIKLCETAINLGDLDAILLLAHIYGSNDKVNPNYEEAIKLYKQYSKTNGHDKQYCDQQIKDIYMSNTTYFIDKINCLKEENKNLESDNENLNIYITHLKTMPFGEDYYKAENNFNELQKKLF